MQQTKTVVAIGAVLVLVATGAIAWNATADFFSPIAGDARMAVEALEAQPDSRGVIFKEYVPSGQWEVLDGRLVPLVLPVQELTALEMQVEEITKSPIQSQIQHRAGCGKY